MIHKDTISKTELQEKIKAFEIANERDIEKSNLLQIAIDERNERIRSFKIVLEELFGSSIFKSDTITEDKNQVVDFNKYTPNHLAEPIMLVFKEIKRFLNKREMIDKLIEKGVPKEVFKSKYNKTSAALSLLMKNDILVKIQHGTQLQNTFYGLKEWTVMIDGTLKIKAEEFLYDIRQLMFDNTPPDRSAFINDKQMQYTEEDNFLKKSPNGKGRAF